MELLLACIGPRKLLASVAYGGRYPQESPLTEESGESRDILVPSPYGTSAVPEGRTLITE